MTKHLELFADSGTFVGESKELTDKEVVDLKNGLASAMGSPQGYVFLTSPEGDWVIVNVTGLRHAKIVEDRMTET